MFVSEGGELPVQSEYRRWICRFRFNVDRGGIGGHGEPRLSAREAGIGSRGPLHWSSFRVAALGHNAVGSGISQLAGPDLDVMHADLLPLVQVGGPTKCEQQ